MLTKSGNLSIFIYGESAIHCGCNFTFFTCFEIRKNAKKKCEVLKIRYSGKIQKIYMFRWNYSSGLIFNRNDKHYEQILAKEMFEWSFI